MTPEKLTEELKAACGPWLRSVILYGSAAAGDHTGRRSDYNVLVVLDRLGMEELKALASPSRRWVKAGNPAPLLFTSQGLAASADAFPLEFSDIRESRQILFGQDLVDSLSVRKENLRLELEHELKGKLIQLRERYLLVADNTRQVMELMIRSLSTFLVLFRGMLRLYEPKVPPKKMEALRALARHVPLEIRVFEIVEQLKRGKKIPGVVPEELFSEYLKAIELAASALDQLLHPSSPQGG